MQKKIKLEKKVEKSRNRTKDENYVNIYLKNVKCFKSVKYKKGS